MVAVGAAPWDGDVVQHRPAGPQQGRSVRAVRRSRGRRGATGPSQGLTRKLSSQPTPLPRPRRPGRPRAGRRCWRGCRPGRWWRPRRPAAMGRGRGYAERCGAGSASPRPLELDCRRIHAVLTAHIATVAA
jgi:hypothetical protein